MFYNNAIYNYETIDIDIYIHACLYQWLSVNVITLRIVVDK